MSNSANTASAELLQSMFEAFNRHDVSAVLSCMTPDCVFEAAGGPKVHGTRYHGHEEVGTAFAQVWATMPDARWDETSHFVTGDRGVSQWTFRGTRADGTRIEAQGCDLFTFRDGKVSLKQAFRKDRPPLT